MEQHGDNDSIAIGDFLRYVLRHWISCVIIVVVAVASAMTYVQLVPAEYSSMASITVVDAPKQQNVNRDIIIGNYVALMTSNRVLNKVEENEHGLSTIDIRNNMTVARDKSNEVITIEYTSRESDKASSVVGATIESFKEAVADMYGVEENSVSILSAPVDSGIAENKSFAMPILVALAGGVMLSLVVSFVRFDYEQQNDETKSSNKKSSKKNGLTDKEKKEMERKQKKIEKDAEDIRKQQVEAELERIKANKIEHEARTKEARARIFQINLSKINREIDQTKKELDKLKTERRIVEEKVEKKKAEIAMNELGLQSASKEISIKEEKRKARRESAEKLRAARMISRINNDADVEIAKIHANSRISAEKSNVNSASTSQQSSKATKAVNNTSGGSGLAIPTPMTPEQYYQNRGITRSQVSTTSKRVDDKIIKGR